MTVETFKTNELNEYKRFLSLDDDDDLRVLRVLGHLVTVSFFQHYY